jgi:hypothetical protein
MHIDTFIRSAVGADLSRTPPIYRPLLAILLCRLIYETSLSALLAGCSTIPLNLLNLIIGPPCPIAYPITIKTMRV